MSGLVDVKTAVGWTSSPTRRAVAERVEHFLRDVREKGQTRNPAGTFSLGASAQQSAEGLHNDEAPVERGFRKRAGDRDRTGDVQLGKLPRYRRSGLRSPLGGVVPSPRLRLLRFE
jgi:hypothetical protein